MSRKFLKLVALLNTIVTEFAAKTSRRPSALRTDPPDVSTFSTAANRRPGWSQEPVHDRAGFCRGWTWPVSWRPSRPMLSTRVPGWGESNPIPSVTWPGRLAVKRMTSTWSG